MVNVLEMDTFSVISIEPHTSDPERLE